jgi:DNA-binding NarL/FixJ family response regulator
MQPGNPTPKRIFMLSSQCLFSQGVESLLRGQRGVEIVGRETDATKAVELIRQLKPDVIVIDGKDLASAPFSIVACLLKEEEGIRIIAMNLENETIRVYRGDQRNALTVDDLIAAIDENGEELRPKSESRMP